MPQKVQAFTNAQFAGQRLQVIPVLADSNEGVMHIQSLLHEVRHGPDHLIETLASHQTSYGQNKLLSLVDPQICQQIIMGQPRPHALDVNGRVDYRNAFR